MNTPATETSIPDLLQSTMKAHAAGQLDAASKGYKLLQALAPENPDVLHLSGMFEGQHGSRERGYELISQAIAIDERDAPAVFHDHNRWRFLQSAHGAF